MYGYFLIPCVIIVITIYKLHLHKLNNIILTEKLCFAILININIVKTLEVIIYIIHI